MLENSDTRDFLRDTRIIICTRNRYLYLKNLLDYISTLGISPSIIVVDASDEPESSLIQSHVENISGNYVKSTIASLQYQKKQGVNYLGTLGQKNIRFVLFLDDDVMPIGNFIFDIRKVIIKMGEHCAGLSGITEPSYNVLKSPLSFFAKAFYLYGHPKGQILKSGINLGVTENQSDLINVDWLIGCSMWRYNILKQVEFNDYLKGSSTGEDVILSLLIRKLGHELFVDPKLRLRHFLADLNRQSSLDLVANRLFGRYLISKLAFKGMKSRLIFYWSIFGELNYHLIFSFLNRLRISNEKNISLKGYFKGLFKITLNKNFKI